MRSETVHGALRFLASGLALRDCRGEGFPLYQIVWSSNEGHFPWNAVARESCVRWQRVLGEAPGPI